MTLPWILAAAAGGLIAGPRIRASVFSIQAAGHRLSPALGRHGLRPLYLHLPPDVTLCITIGRGPHRHAGRPGRLGRTDGGLTSNVKFRFLGRRQA